MAAASWLLALTTSADDGINAATVVNAVLSLGLGIGAVLLIPIKRIWLRWLINPLILSIPILAALDLFVG